MVLSIILQQQMVISESKYLLATVTTLEKPRKYINFCVEHIERLKFQVWSRRFEKVMLVVALTLTSLIVLASTLISKGLSILMIAQVSTRPGKTMAFCNQRRLIPGIDSFIYWTRIFLKIF